MQLQTNHKKIQHGDTNVLNIGLSCCRETIQHCVNSKLVKL